MQISNAIFSLLSVLAHRLTLVLSTSTTRMARPWKRLCPFFGYAFNTVWKDLGPEVRRSLDSLEVLWTVVRVHHLCKVLHNSLWMT